MRIYHKIQMTFFQNFDLVNIKENSKNGYGIMRLIKIFRRQTSSLIYTDDIESLKYILSLIAIFLLKSKKRQLEECKYRKN